MELKVNDMSCGGCANSITRAVTSVDPAAKLEIDIATRMGKVDSVLTSERLAAVIEAAGYHPTVNALPHRPTDTGEMRMGIVAGPNLRA